MVTGCLVAGTEWNQGGLEQVHGTMTSNIFLWEQNERTTAGVEFQHTEKEAKNNNKKKSQKRKFLKLGDIPHFCGVSWGDVVGGL